MNLVISKNFYDISKIPKDWNETRLKYILSISENKSSNFNDEKIRLLEPIAGQILWLNLARTNISDKGISMLPKFKLLSRLHLENTNITDAATSHISKLSNLKYLNMYGTNISDTSIPHLKKLGNLKKVFLQC